MPAKPLLFLLAILALCAPATAFAAAPPVIRGGAVLDSPPWSFADAEGQPSGLGVELLRAVSETMGLDLRLTPGPWSALWDALVAGELDVLPVVAHTPGRAPLVELGLPHTETFDAFFVREGTAPIGNLAAAAGRAIAVVRSDAAHHQLTERQFAGTLVPVESIAEGLRAVAAGRLDALLCAKTMGELERQRIGLRGVTSGPPIPDYKRTFSFGVRKGNTELKEKLDQGLLLVKASGEYDRLYRTWLGVSAPSPAWWQTAFWAAMGLLGSLGLLVFAGIAARNAMVLDAAPGWSGLAFWRYALAVTAVAAGYALHLALETLTGPGLPAFMTFYPAIMVAALLGGLRPGLLATALAVLLGAVSLLLPIWAIDIASPVDWIALTLLCGIGVLMSVMAEHYRRGRDAAAAYAREQAMRESGERFLALAQASSLAVYRMSPDWSELRHLLGHGFLTDTETPSRTWPEIYLPPEERPKVMAAIAQAARTGDIFALEHRVRRADGGLGWASSRAVPIRAASGAIIEWFGIATDTTPRKLAEEALRERAEEVECLLEVVPTAVWVAQDPACLDIAGNPRANTVYEAAPDENVSASTRPEARRFFRPDGRELAPEELPMQVAAATNQEVRDAELEVRLASGRTRFILGNAAPLRDPRGEVRGAVGAFLDITDRKRAEEAQRESAAKYSYLFESIDEAFCIVELLFDGERPVDYRFLETNPAFERHTGITQGVGRQARELIPSLEEHWLQVYGKVATTGEPVRLQSHVQGLGRVFDVYAFRVGTPEQRQVAVLFSDITEKQCTETALRESEERFRELFTHAAIGLAINGPDYGYLDVNAAYSAMTGYTRAELLACKGPALIHPDDWPANRALTERLLAQEIPGFIVENRYLRKGGESLWVRKSVSLIRHADGTPRWFVTLVEDITEHRRAEEALRRSERRYRTLIDATRAVTWSCPSSGLHIEPQPEWMAFTGQGAEEMLGAGWTQAVHPEDMAVAAERWAAAVARGEPFFSEHRIRRHDGAWRWMSVHAAPISDSSGALVEWIGMNLDIDERKTAEAALRRSREGLSRLAEASLSIMARTAVGDLLQVLAESALRLTGARLAIGAQGSLGRPAVIARRVCAPLAADEAPQALSEEGLQLDPSRLHGALLASGEALRLTEAQVQAHPWWAQPDGPPLARGLLGVPLRARSGETIGTLLVTDKRSGDFDLEDEVLLMQLAAVAGLALQHVEARRALEEADQRKDTFLATLAHELRNPLAPIRSACAILKLTGSAEPAARAAHELIDRQVGHLVRLIDDLLDVSRITRGKLALHPEPVELAAVLEAALEIARAPIEKAGHRLTLALPTAPVRLLADRVRLAQVFANLLNNACKYSPPGGEITLRVELQGAEVVVRVADTGIGIPPEHLAQVFDLFHQVPVAASQVQAGLGIGLSLVQGLVAMHGGWVEALSEGLGRGSTFSVHLPAVPGEAPPLAVSPEPEAVQVSGRVLLADDQEDNLDSLAAALRLYGLEVETARDGLEAVAAAERFQPDLTLLDLGMPNLDGFGACRQIRAQPWGQRLTLVALTGWGADSDRDRSAAAGFDAHLTKPVALQEVLLHLESARRQRPPEPG